MNPSSILAVLLALSIPSEASARNYSAPRAVVLGGYSTTAAAMAVPLAPLASNSLAPSPIPAPTISPTLASALKVDPSPPLLSGVLAQPRGPHTPAKDEKFAAMFDGARERKGGIFGVLSGIGPSPDTLPARSYNVYDAAYDNAVNGSALQNKSGLAPAPVAARPSTPVFVMTPLSPITNWESFRKQLDTLKRNGIAGVTTDLWWGKFEGAGHGKFDWSYYLKYAETVRAAGLQWEPILSFHRCGGNVGDDCSEPLPSWLWDSSPNASQEMKFIDRKGFVNDEHVAFWHEASYSHYASAMVSFAAHFSPYSDIITRISVGMGPAGELRYPSYNFAAGWTYPQRGRLQAYSAGARRSFRASVRARYSDDLQLLNRAWGTAFNSFDEVEPPNDEDLFFRTQTRSPYGRDFLGWYQSALEGHLERMMALAHEHLSPAFPARLNAKIAGVHWLYNSPDAPHAAENAAGYIDYARLIDRFKAAGADLTFTALEMDDAGANEIKAGEPPPFSAPQTLTRAIAALARIRGVATWGENALPIYNGKSYRNVAAMLASEGFSGFSLLRLNDIVDTAGEPTSQMALFVSHVVSPPNELRSSRREKGNAAAPLLAWIALAAGLLLGAPWLTAHYAAMAAASGWAANAIFLFFPWMQILENFRNSRTLRRGGEQAREANERLRGVSAGSQEALIGGNMLNYPSFLAGGSPALIGNALMGAAGSLLILLPLAMSNHFSRRRLALLTAGVVAAALLPLVLPVSEPICSALGIAATAVFSYFTVPQILKNRNSLAALRGKATEPQAAKDALERLKGVSPRYLLIGLLGNILLVPLFLLSGHWWNVLGGLVGIFGPMLILSQLSKAGLFPQTKPTPLTAAFRL